MSDQPQNPQQPQPQTPNQQLQISVEELKKAKIYVAAPMYGGMCYGVFAKAANELSTLCSQYGVDLRFYYLFNESLITRARNYCIQRDMMVDTEDGPKPIKWIVDNEYKGKVLSYNFETHKKEWNKVVNHWGRPNDEKKQWVKLDNGTKSKKSLICTSDHQIAVIDDILNPGDIRYVAAKDSEGAYSVRNNNTDVGNRSLERSLYNKEQLSMMIGMLFGDSHINKHGTLTFKHSIKQKEYALYKSEILGATSCREYDRDDKSFIDVYVGTNEQTKVLRDKFYVGENRGRSAKNLIPYIDEIALAYWYMDNGSLHKTEGKRPFSTIYNMGFDSYSDHLMLQDHFETKFGITPSISKMKYENGDRYYLQFSADDSVMLSSIIGKYVHPSMRYKLVEYEDDTFVDINDKMLPYSAYKIKNIIALDAETDSRAQSKLYDIEVDKVHNFFANGSLVHNCVDEFLRSDCTHMVFIDSDIGFNPVDVLTLVALQMRNPDTYDVVVGAYPKKCFHHNTKVWTKDGVKNIASMARENYKGEVLSVNNKTGKFEYKPIIGYNIEENISKKWVSLKLFNWNNKSKLGSPSSLIVTDDHDIAYVDNPLDGEIKYTEAKNMKGKWVVQTCRSNKETSNRRKIRYPVFAKEKISALVGNILGDGYIGPNGNCIFVQQNDDYFAHFVNIFDCSKTWKNKTDGNVAQFVNANTKYFRDKFYNMDGKKTIKNVLHLIDEISLAHMYMDDGSLYSNGGYDSHKWDKDIVNDKSWWYNNKTGENKRTSDFLDENYWTRGRKKELNKKASLSSLMNMPKEESELFVTYLKNKFDIEGFVVEQKSKGKLYPLIKFDHENTIKWCKLIAPYVCEAMNYKLVPEAKEIEKFDWYTVHDEEYALSEVKDVVSYESKTSSKLYDVGIADNHNLVVNDGIVAHNSISWEKISKAVEVNPVMQRRERMEGTKTISEDIRISDNPMLLQHFVGDFVFNPVANQQQFSIYEPVPIAEAGTGFMCVPRKTFERFEEAFPEYKYYPDHVRTEHFDGSRLITQFFQAEIDVPSSYKRLIPALEKFKNEELDRDQLLNIFNDFQEEYNRASRRYLSEDYWFSQKVRELGMNIMLCPWMQMTHMGSYPFGGSLAALSSIQASPTASAESNPNFYKNKPSATAQQTAQQPQNHEEALKNMIAENRKLREKRKKNKK